RSSWSRWWSLKNLVNPGTLTSAAFFGFPQELHRYIEEGLDRTMSERCSGSVACAVQSTQMEMIGKTSGN
ncbi:hypothetical protein CHARACLAT_028093, partial [Characodon lateralis]|nr:hypothetical protein [Characodon lateralis]